MFRVLLAVLCMPALAQAADLIVLEARGIALKPGQKIAHDSPISLKEGERLTVIGPDGKSTTLRGPFAGAPMPGAAATTDPKQALAALIATRDARTSSVGVIRAGGQAEKLPEPWLIDISRAGPRCLQEGELPIWWRPQADSAQSFVVFPIDRSWRADFVWKIGQERQPVPPLSRFAGQNTFIISMNQQEYAVSITTIPKGMDNDFVLASWMLEKGCVQQADALIRSLDTAREGDRLIP
ncbi:MAG: hypothetical protein RIR70_1898 [Pseudomonadota bacterium]|jgi:hypothetical protein